MTAQFDLFAAPAPPPAPPRAPVAAGAPATKPKPAPARPSKAKREPEPAAPAVVVTDPQLPILGAFAKIDGHWHRWKALGWEIVRPPEHSAHLRATPPRLGSNGWINEPHPKPATVHMDGHALRIEWSEHGFSVHSGDKHLLHFRALAACAVGAAEIARADPHFQGILASLKEPEPEADDDDDEATEQEIAEQEFEAECPEDAREDDPDDNEPPATQPAASEMPRDELGEQLIAQGLTPNAYLLDLNRTISPPHEMELGAPWNLPSRMFRFPIETNAASVDRDGIVHPRTIGLMHPLLVDHPFVIETEKRLGIKLDPNGAPNPYGFTNTRNAQWWHSVDLISAGMWRELLETRQFTTNDDIVGAVAYGLDYGPHEGRKGGRAHLTVAEAQQILKAIGAVMPKDGSVIDALRGVQLSEFKGESGKLQRAISWRHESPLSRTWARLAGIERGWFKTDRSGFIKWTDKALIEQRNLKAAAGEDVAPVPVPEGCLL